MQLPGEPSRTTGVLATDERM